MLSTNQDQAYKARRDSIATLFERPAGSLNLFVCLVHLAVSGIGWNEATLSAIERIRLLLLL